MSKSAPDAAQCAIQLRHAVFMLARRLRSGLQQDGLSVAKLSVVGRLHRDGAMTPTDLAAQEGVKLQSLTRLLAELEADGWLAREAHASDGRQSLLGLTAQGKRRLGAAVQAGDASLTGVIAASLAADERALLSQACALLERINDAFGTSAEGVPPDLPVPARQRRRRS
ncbi:MAG: MarR family transcriptional regulator [Burkholderiales bacterium]|jgi:DNA-binding MarR family transcriptional regulator|nr:MarR family transcriptional regulator [Burkholderiales bacterium]